MPRFFQITASPDGLPLLFRKKSRLLWLFACKRAHNAAAALPTFCGAAPVPFGISKSKNGKQLSLLHLKVRQVLVACRDFFKSRRRLTDCRSFSAKSHACSGCSLASALTTPPRRYQLFAGGKTAPCKGAVSFISKKMFVLTNKILPTLLTTPKSGGIIGTVGLVKANSML